MEKGKRGKGEKGKRGKGEKGKKGKGDKGHKLFPGLTIKKTLKNLLKLKILHKFLIHYL